MSTTVPARRNKVPFIALTTANVISLAGNTMSYIAVPWFVLETTGSASKAGLSAFFTTLPAVLAAFFGSALVDRTGFRRSSIISDVASGVTVALIPLLHALQALEFWHLLALVFLGSLLDAPGATARASLVPDLAELGGIKLERAAAAQDGAGRAAQLLGAPIGGVLIAWLGPTMAIWINALTFIVSALLVAVFLPASLKTHKPERRESLREEILSGLSFIRRDRLLVALVLTIMITNLLDAALGSVVMPVYGRQVFGNAADLGTLIAAFSMGAVIGTVAFGAVGHRLPRRPTFATAFVLMGLRYWALALFPPLPVLLLATFLCGLAVGPVNPIASTVEYERVPAHLRARVIGAGSAGVMMAMPLGGLLAGYLLEWVGLLSTLLLLGTAYLLTTLSLGINPALSEMNRPPATQTAAKNLSR